MSGRYLTDLADVLRRAGLRVTEMSGWQTRARSSGGYASGRPWGVMWHHTASGTSWDGQRDADYIATGDSDAPLANLYIDRTGLVWVIAAGATNTNGKGGPLTRWSRGTVPADSMNTYAIGIEIGNDGVGGPYPVVQVDACFAASIACCVAYGLAPSDVCTHAVWAPGRKIDPARADAVQGPWRPRSTNSSGSWNLDDLAAECARRAAGGPAPSPEPEPEEDDDDMSKALLLQGTPSGSLQVADALMTVRRPISGESYGPLLATDQYAPVTIPDDDVNRIPFATEWTATT